MLLSQPSPPHKAFVKIDAILTSAMLVGTPTYLSRRKGQYLQKEREPTVRAQTNCTKVHRNFSACLQSMQSRK